MPQAFVRIRGIDPLLFRDGRPFTAEAGGLTARSLPLPFPTTVAAFIRTQIGKQRGWDWSNDVSLRFAHTIPVDSPLLQIDGGLALPAPGDALPVSGSSPVQMSPQEWAAGMCDLPDGMLPVMPNGDHPEGKPPTGHNFWPVDTMLEWLDGSIPDRIEKIPGLPEEERIGIAIQHETRAAREGKLYAIRLRAFEERALAEGNAVKRSEYAFIARVNLPNNHDVHSAGSLGGERRLTVVERIDDTPAIWPRCPQELKDKIGGARRVRMILATPAHFEGGWRPSWIECSGSGAAGLPAGIAKVRLKLIGAAVGRRIALSGWGLREGPRGIRWLAPAGSVYFFEVEDGDTGALWRDAWMEPMSDNEQDRRDGLGLALWGIW